jgi:hypothetical protein
LVLEYCQPNNLSLAYVWFRSKDNIAYAKRIGTIIQSRDVEGQEAFLVSVFRGVKGGAIGEDVKQDLRRIVFRLLEYCLSFKLKQREPVSPQGIRFNVSLPAYPSVEAFLRDGSKTQLMFGAGVFKSVIVARKFRLPGVPVSVVAAGTGAVAHVVITKANHAALVAYQPLLRKYVAGQEWVERIESMLGVVGAERPAKKVKTEKDVIDLTSD